MAPRLQPRRGRPHDVRSSQHGRVVREAREPCDLRRPPPRSVSRHRHVVDRRGAVAAAVGWGVLRKPCRSEVEEALKAACASLLRKIGDLAETRPDDFKAQELANVAWSFATADLDAPRLYASLATSATPRLAQFSAQELANVCDPRGNLPFDL